MSTTPIIDAHMHWQSADMYTTTVFNKWDVRVINTCMIQIGGESWRTEQAEIYRDLALAHPDRFAWISGFELPLFNDPTYIERVIAQLENDFKTGAVGCKIWKNIGMEIKKPDGQFLMPDDAMFDPLWETIADSGRTLLAHLAEPMACWRPLDEASPHFSYYNRFPEWHMFNHPDYPRHEVIMAARDRILEKHPNLKVVGAHLASLEWDADILRERLDRYPNLAVDISARMADLAFQDPQKVRRLFDAHPERILFGTDEMMVNKAGGWTDEQQRQRAQELNDCYEMHFAYFESKEPVTVNGRQVQGLGLEPGALERLYQANAQHWYSYLKF
jgi:predicted TIM-barrel fold metal-dependent hydrolase